MTTSTKLLCAIAILTAPAFPSFAQGSYDSCTGDGWLEKSDEAFTEDCVSMAFTGDLSDRERLAWMFFARVNQLIAVTPESGMSKTDKVPVWMAWPTDPDTFSTTERFAFQQTPRVDMKPSIEKQDLEAGNVATADPDGANEEVTRNKISYDYLADSGLTTRAGIAAFFVENDYVDMPIGSIELKASWLQVTPGSPAPAGALTFAFDSDEYWWRGLHIMVKMQTLSDPTNVFYTEDPSWFWTTFEFSENPGVQHVREAFISQRAPLPEQDVADILATADLSGFGLEGYAPNGTQIRFTENGDGAVPLILGHTNMEDFAGKPNTAQAQYWTTFQASCHSCHATASYNPKTRSFFPFSVPTGALTPGYNVSDASHITHFLGQGYKSLDFMWPIAFQTQ